MSDGSKETRPDLLSLLLGLLDPGNVTKDRHQLTPFTDPLRLHLNVSLGLLR
jgi:hypothetical protein